MAFAPITTRNTTHTATSKTSILHTPKPRIGPMRYLAQANRRASPHSERSATHPKDSLCPCDHLAKLRLLGINEGLDLLRAGQSIGAVVRAHHHRCLGGTEL